MMPCRTSWSSGTDPTWPEHSGAAATDTRVSFPDVRHALTLTCGPDAADTLATSTAAGPRVPASAYPPAAAAAGTHSVAARGTSFLGFLVSSHLSP